MKSAITKLELETQQQRQSNASLHHNLQSLRQLLSQGFKGVQVPGRKSLFQILITDQNNEEVFHINLYQWYKIIILCQTLSWFLLYSEPLPPSKPHLPPLRIGYTCRNVSGFKNVTDENIDEILSMLLGIVKEKPLQHQPLINTARSIVARLEYCHNITWIYVCLFNNQLLGASLFIFLYVFFLTV